MAWTLRRSPLGSRPATTVTAPAAPPAPEVNPGARSLPLSDSRATERPLEASIAVREVLDFPMLYLADLPGGWSIDLTQLDGSPLTITSQRHVYERMRSVGAHVVDKRWLVPLTLAAEHGRGNRCTLADWLTRVSQDPSWTLTPQHAFAGVPGRFEPRHWTTERVCLAYGMRLVSVS